MSSPVILQLPKAVGESREADVPVRRILPSPGPLSDVQLVQAVAAGDKEAIAVLFERHGQRVRNVVVRILRDEAEADDVRQEIFLYLYEKAASYDPNKSTPASWIMQIAYHRAIDRRRALASRQHYCSSLLDDQVAASVGSPRIADRIDGAAILERSRSQLTREQRETLELHFFEGYSFREIAEQSGQTVGNVRHHYYRALERLRANVFSKKRR